MAPLRKPRRTIVVYGLLMLDFLGQIGYFTSARVAAIVAVGVALITGTVLALRRASRRVDTILREELDPKWDPE